MIWRTWVITFLILLGLALQAFAGDKLSASVKKIIDGDSLLVTTSGGTVEVRLYGVDCPEYDQPFSREAKILAERKVLGKKVRIEPVDQDTYGRMVAVVTQGQNVLNRDLVLAGLAWVYPRYCKKSFCASWKQDERTAREEKLGLWQHDQPDPPWQWKRNKRGR